GTGSCVTGATAPPYAAEVEDEMRGLRSYLSGERPLYRVVDFGGDKAQCFRLDLALALPSPPYGDHALFCFDRASGAPALTEIHRDEAVDTTIAREIRTEVRPE